MSTRSWWRAVDNNLIQTLCLAAGAVAIVVVRIVEAMS